MFFSKKYKKLYKNFNCWIANNYAADTYFIPDYIKARELLSPNDCKRIETLDDMDLLIYTILGNWHLFYKDLLLLYQTKSLQKKRNLLPKIMLPPNPVLNTQLTEYLINRTILDKRNATDAILLQEIELSLNRLKNTRLKLNRIFSIRILNTFSYCSTFNEMFIEPTFFLFCREHEIGYFIPRQLIEVYNLNLNRTNLSLYHHLLQLMLHHKKTCTTVELQSFSNISPISNVKWTFDLILDAFENNKFITNWHFSTHTNEYKIYLLNHYDASPYLSSLQECI